MGKPWDEYFIDLALNVATCSICDRAFIGCALVNSDNRIVSTSYDGAINDNPHCDEVGRILCDGHCITTIHAEMNALLYCAKEGVAVKGCIRYVAHFPCLNCTKSLIQAGISKIHYHEAYRVDEHVIELLDRNNIECV